jgi:hypothetical protein
MRARAASARARRARQKNPLALQRYSSKAKSSNIHYFVFSIGTVRREPLHPGSCIDDRPYKLTIQSVLHDPVHIPGTRKSITD